MFTRRLVGVPTLGGFPPSACELLDTEGLHVKRQQACSLDGVNHSIRRACDK